MQDLSSSLSKLQHQEMQAAAMRGKHMDLTFQIYCSLVSKGYDAESLIDLEATAQNSILAATVMFKTMGLIKEN